MTRHTKFKIRHALLLCFLMISTICYSSQLFINKLRVIRKPHHWQFVFETNSPIHCRSRLLRSPNRIVVDCPRVHLKHMIHDADYVMTPVTKIHVRHLKQTLQMTLDLDHPLKINSFSLPAVQGYHHRYVIDMKGHRIPVIGFANTPAKKVTKSLQPITPYVLKPIVTSESTPSVRARQVIVVIDPGHGGKDPGATGYHGAHEKNVVLAISKDMQKDINRIPGFTAVLTRRGDYFIPLRGRLAIARRYKADMFIAIHADAYPDKSAHGVSVFALSRRGATSEAARWLAARENKSELMGGVDLGDKSNMLKSVLINLSQFATIRTSLQIGGDLVKNIGKFAHLHHGDRVEQAAFVVLKSPDIPSLLVETGFISNQSEEQHLVNTHYQHRLAQSISNGITQYFENHPPRGTVLAKRHHSIFF